MPLAGDETTEPAFAVFTAAAASLESGQRCSGAAGELLDHLRQSQGGVTIVSADENARLAVLLRAAARFTRVFAMEAPDAPGLITLGAEVDPAAIGVPGHGIFGVGGAGLTFRRAFEACVGEGAELLSQFAHPGDQLERMPDERALARASPALRDMVSRMSPYRRNSAPIHWVEASDPWTGETMLLPADICYRRPAEARDIDVPWPLSVGCGAGPDPAAAMLHGLLELIERDATVLWWRGGMAPRQLEPDTSTGPLLRRLRGGRTRRRTWLLDITSDIEVPVVAAIACNDDGYGAARGIAAAASLAEAAASAIVELTQMELAHHLSLTKLETRGEQALNAIDRQHIQRYTAIPMISNHRLYSSAPPRSPCDFPATDQQSALDAIRSRLARRGLIPGSVDLSRESLGIAVTRMVCPGLEPDMGAPPGPRLRAAAAASGVDLNCPEPVPCF